MKLQASKKDLPNITLRLMLRESASLTRDEATTKVEQLMAGEVVHVTFRNSTMEKKFRELCGSYLKINEV